MNLYELFITGNILIPRLVAVALCLFILPMTYREWRRAKDYRFYATLLFFLVAVAAATYSVSFFYQYCERAVTCNTSPIFDQSAIAVSYGMLSSAVALNLLYRRKEKQGEKIEYLEHCLPNARRRKEQKDGER